MPLLRRIIGSVLRRLRLAQGRTLQDVARDADVSLPYLSEIERGRKEASSEILAAICRALGIGLGDLLDEARRELARTDPRRVSPRATASAWTGDFSVIVPADRVAAAFRAGTSPAGASATASGAGDVTAGGPAAAPHMTVVAGVPQVTVSVRAGAGVPRAMASARVSRGAPRSAARLCGGVSRRLRASVALEAILRAEESFEGTAVVAAR